MLTKEIECQGTGDRPDCAWNLEVSGFPHNPSKCKHIVPIDPK